MGARHTSDRWRRFAAAYSRNPNGTRAAIEAGYSPRGAHVTASRLLQRAKVQELIAATYVKRDVHAEETYRNLILLANASLKEASDVCGWQHPESKHSDPEVRAKVIEVARRCVETLAKAEGLMIDVHKIEGDLRLSVSVGERVQKHWDPEVSRLYMGLSEKLLLPHVVGEPSSNGNGSH